MSIFQRKLSNNNNQWGYNPTTPPPKRMMWGKEVWGVAFPFPENHLGEVKESKHFEVEGEGWSTGNQMAAGLSPKKETLGGMNQETFLFWILLILLALSSQKQSNTSQKTSVSVQACRFLRGIGHPASWIDLVFLKNCCHKSRCLWNPSGNAGWFQITIIFRTPSFHTDTPNVVSWFLILYVIPVLFIQIWYVYHVYTRILYIFWRCGLWNL